jgi:hypothetical protein
MVRDIVNPLQQKDMTGSEPAGALDVLYISELSLIYAMIPAIMPHALHTAKSRLLMSLAWTLATARLVDSQSDAF